jgi:cytochrome P450
MTSDSDDPGPGHARFDEAQQAWVLSNYADVSTALREPRLVVPGTALDAHAAHLAVREAGATALSPARLAAWRDELEQSARRLAESLAVGRTIDLVTAFAQPWSLGLAATATGIPAAEAERLSPLAREVFLAAARSTDFSQAPAAQAAAARLAQALPTASVSVSVQSFVALTQTLPCFLASAWLELARNPAEALRLRTTPALLPHAIEELLRHAGPARAVFREATTEVVIGRATIPPGGRVVLRLSTANRDPAQFPDPDRLDFGRAAAGHLAFGKGAHSCSGAQLIRLAAAVATSALLQATTAVELTGPVEWIGGFAIRAPSTLPVLLTRDPDGQAEWPRQPI